MKYNVYGNAIQDENILCATIELLTKCNWKCKHCYIPEHTNLGLSTEVIFSLLDELRMLGVFELTLTGGELFLRDDAIEIIKKARSNYFNVILLSNVSLLDEQKIYELSQLYLEKISCTIFSLNSNIHDSITGIKGSLDSAMRNIMLLKKYRVPVEIKNIVMNENSEEYKKISDFCDMNGFMYQYSPIIISQTDRNISPIKYRLSETQLFNFFNETLPKDTLKSKTKLDSFVCKTIRYAIDIDCNGNVYPCNTFHGTGDFGNIQKNSLASIWESEKMTKLRNIKWSDYSKCSRCNLISFCHQCPGITSLENPMDQEIPMISSLACLHAKVRYELFNRKEV